MAKMFPCGSWLQMGIRQGEIVEAVLRWQEFETLGLHGAPHIHIFPKVPGISSFRMPFGCHYLWGWDAQHFLGLTKIQNIKKYKNQQFVGKARSRKSKRYF